jgi:membrane-associated phospholipid phosphatase
VDARLEWSWARRALGDYLFALAVSAQVAFLLDMTVGVPLENARMTWVLAAVVPIGYAIARRLGVRDSSPGPSLGLATLAGASCWVGWAGSYFVVGMVVDPDRAVLLSSSLERHLPFEPRFTLLYVAVYPLAMLPAFLLRDAALMGRLVRGWIAMILVADACFVLFPVAVDRPELTGVAPSYGRWALSLVYGTDPSSNCLPSTHCAMALWAALALSRHDRRLGVWAWATALAIGGSTLLLRQHYLVDVLAGYALAIVAWKVFVVAPQGEGELAHGASLRTRARTESE